MQLTKELLHQLLVVEGKSLSQVARIADKNVSQVSRAAKSFKIVSRHLDKAASKPLPITSVYQKYINGTSLHALHIEYGRPVAAVKRQLKKHYPDIVFRTHDQAVRPDSLNDPIALEEYARQNMTCKQIAQQLDVKEATVYAAYQRENVSRFRRDLPPVVAKDELYDLYWTREKSLTHIGELFGTFPGHIADLLRSYGLAVRGFGGARKSSHTELNDRDWLYDEYVVKSRSMAFIARSLKTTVGNIAHFLNRYNIEVRSKEEVCNLLSGHGSKCVVGTERFGAFECDSLLEAAFVDSVKDSATSLIRPAQPLSFLDMLYYPDFELDGEFVEVKAASEALKEGPDRRRLVKQMLIAGKSGKQCRLWVGKFVNFSLSNSDRYYCQDWRLLFDDPEACADWLLKFGFRGVHYSRHHLLKGLDRLETIMAGGDLMNANLPAVQTVDILKHFSPHYWDSSYVGYLPASAAWGTGNQIVFRTALRELWANGKEINLYGLVKHVTKRFKDFSGVSIFKPWVAAEVYRRLLPDGGVVFDPCIGWGGRLLGCLDSNVRYVGCDINPQAISGVSGLAKFVGSRICPPTLLLNDMTRDEFHTGDLLFTSPPYDETEQYAGTGGIPMSFDTLVRRFVSDFAGRVALSVPRRFEDKTKAIGTAAGRRLLAVYMMRTGTPIVRETVDEPIIVFERR